MTAQRDMFRKETGPAEPRLTSPTDAEIRLFSLWRPWPQSMHGWVERTKESLDKGTRIGLKLHKGPKWIENRGWHPPEALVGRCFIAIHSGLTMQGPGHESGDAHSFLRARGWDYRGPFPKACITGVAFLDSQFGRCDDGCRRCDARTSTNPFYMGGVAWVWTGLVPLVDPVPCTGGQGLRRLLPEVDAALRVEYRRSVEVLGDQLDPGPRWVS